MKELLTQVHQDLVDEVRSVMAERIIPRRDDIEESETIPDDIYRHMARAGWYGVAIPQHYGGRGAGHLARLLMIEEAAHASGAIGGALQSAILGTAMLQFYGSEGQKQHWLPRFARGDDVCSICVTEPGSGSHVMGMKTTARREGHEYVLDGVKCWIANSHIASVHGVIARTGEGSRGLSAFLVEGDRHGVRPGRANNNTGLRGFNIGEVIFENCRIPATNRLGEEGMGLEIAHRAITCYGKPNLTAVALGVHQAVLDETVDYAGRRNIYGGPLTELESARLKIGDIYTHLATARQAAYWAVYLLDKRGHADEEIILAKLIGTEAAFNSAKAAMDLFAARGTSRDAKVERYLRDLLMVFPPAGTSDVHRKRLAEVAMGEYTPSVSPRAEAPVQLGVA